MNPGESSSVARKLSVIVLCGFLGAGKTTLLKRLLRDGKRRFAVIVNDLSELAVDAELIAETRVRGDAKLVNLNHGSLSGELILELQFTAAGNCCAPDFKWLQVRGMGLSGLAIAFAHILNRRLSHFYPHPGCTGDQRVY